MEGGEGEAGVGLRHSPWDWAAGIPLLLAGGALAEPDAMQMACFIVDWNNSHIQLRCLRHLWHFLFITSLEQARRCYKQKMPSASH